MLCDLCEFWIAVFKVKVTVRVQIIQEYLCGWYLLNQLPSFMNLVWWCIIMTRGVMRKGWVPIFKVKGTVRAQKLQKICFFRISWSFEPFVTRLAVPVHHHKSEFCVTILDCCPQGHNEGPNLQGIFVRTISFEPLNFLNETWSVCASSWPGVAGEKLKYSFDTSIPF